MAHGEKEENHPDGDGIFGCGVFCFLESGISGLGG